MPKQNSSPRLLVVFNTVSLYGMERGVIGTLDALRPNITPHFLMSYTTYKLNLPVLAEIQRRKLSHSFLSDKSDWPRIEKPKSLKHVWQMLFTLVRGNLDVLKESLRRDILYLPSICYFYFAIFACLLYRLSGRRVLYHFHDLVIRPSFRLRIATFFVTDFIHCSQLGYNQVKAANPYILRKRNFALPYHTGDRLDVPKDSCDITAHFEGKRNILFLGQVSWHKGVDILIEAFKFIIGNYDDIVLHIVGRIENSKFEKEFRDLTAAPAINQRIKCWGYREDIYDLLDMTYLHVQPSPPSRFMDTFPLAVLEAMKRGIPTVCFNSGGLQELVIHEETGLICQEEDSRCMAQNLRRLLDDVEFRNRCSGQARERYEKYFSELPVRENWLQAFRDGR